VGKAFGVGVLVVSCVLMATSGHAQAPAQAAAPATSSPPAAAAPAASPPSAQATHPVTGFVSAYEIARIAVSAGFDPLAPPLREGTTYVLRATDYRGILMRVVIDARTGAIRDANRIVPGPGRYGQLGMASPYDPAEFDTPGYEPPLPPPAFAPTEASVPSMAPSLAPSLAPPHTGSIAAPPLPRPRPAALKPPIGSEVSTAASPPPAVAPQTAPMPTKKPALVEPLND
jgi:hypothetical protein